ncbi:MAG: hypothetical protein EZS28_025790 [Streblomastix strix]|uniref:Uncharacterized protein n=1 Tax=Streblomastix strix TaxID=222440 RepID=A0A5J4V875_9EUKA|nr:MAG: hypothetical protein EZS28_025790 [Streblomastix strix]
MQPQIAPRRFAPYRIDQHIEICERIQDKKSQIQVYGSKLNKQPISMSQTLLNLNINNNTQSLSHFPEADLTTYPLTDRQRMPSRTQRLNSSQILVVMPNETTQSDEQDDITAEILSIIDDPIMTQIDNQLK